MRYLVYGIIVILAILLDLWLMRRWSRWLQSRESPSPDSRIYVWGGYSPLITWLRKRFPRLGLLQFRRSFVTQELGSESKQEGIDALTALRINPIDGGILIIGGAMLAITSWVLATLIGQSHIQPMGLPKNIKLTLSLITIGGLVFLTIGAYALIMKRFPGWLESMLKTASRWLGVSIWQLFCLILSPFFATLAALLGSGRQEQLPYPGLAIPVWLVGISLAVAGSFGWPVRIRFSRSVVILFILLVSFALIVRAVDNTHITTTLTGDEGQGGINALAFREGRANNIFGVGWRGFPAMYFFLQSLPVGLFGRTAAALRISSALAGALTVGGIFIVGSALYGRWTGLLAAIFLSAFHFHIHFSRIGLNNIWDGLSFTLVLGALWAGWQTGKRGYFALAGIGLGFAQYFYISSRVLVILVVVWLFLAFLFSARGDRARIKAALPGLVFMLLVAMVVALPLGWFYARHPSAFTDSTKAQSIFGQWMESTRQATGKSEISILFDQIKLGFRGYLSTPLKWFYRPNVPILRQLPAVVFVLGLIFLLLRPRDLRTSLLGLWLIAFGLVGALSESTPAAQRYVAAAPVCALVVGYAVAQLAALLRRAWPRAKMGVSVAALLFVALMSVDDLRFYFLEYAPNSYYKGKYDFEGFGSAVTMRLARYLDGYNSKDFNASDWQVLFFGLPDLKFYTIPTMRFLVPSIQGVDIPHPWGQSGTLQPQTPNQIYVFLPKHQDDLAAVQAASPEGRLVTELDDKGGLLYTLYQVPPDPISQPRVSVEGKFGLFQPTFVWALIFLVIAGLAIAWLRRSRPDWNWLETETEEIALLSVWEAWLRSQEPPVTTMIETNPSPPNHTSSDSQEAPAGENEPAQPVTEGSPSPIEEAPPAAETTSQSAAAPETAIVFSEQTATPISSNTARVNITVDVPEGMTVHVIVSSVAAGQQPAISQHITNSRASAAHVPAIKPPFVPLRERLGSSVSIGKWALSPQRVFWLVMLVYVATRLIGLERWPIFFFTDEAVQTVMASDFVHNDFKNYEKESWPIYFNNGSSFNLSSVSVYVQVIPYLLFGKSVFVTRAVSALIGALAAVVVGLILRDIFKIRFWWSGVLLLSITPAWFLHSRTAFETVELSTFYALFLFFYLLYRHRSPPYLFASLFFGALVFYTYSPGALIMAVSGVLLLVSDLPYHWKHRKYALLGLLFLAVLAIPYIRYMDTHPGVTRAQLCTRATYWCEPGSIISKLGHYLNEYKRGFNLSYWYIPNRIDLDRHLMKGYGHILWFTAPFMLIGLGVAMWNFHSSGYRTVLIALLAAPAGSALVQIGITRALVFLIPVTILTTVGVAKVLEFLIDPIRQLRAVRPPGFLAWFGKAGRELAEQPLFSGLLIQSKQSRPISSQLVGVLLFVILAGINFYMLRDALVNGPTWFQQYDMGGMQYGAIPLFREVKQYVEEHPDLNLMVSPDWANGTDVVARFFLPGPMPITLGSFKSYEYRYLPDIEQRAFVLIPADWDAMQASNKFKNIQVDKILYYPNGKPGFYFVRVQYADNVGQLLQAEVNSRHQLQEASVTLDNEPVKVKYSYLDMGSIANLFDGSKETLARTMEANPFVIELDFPSVRSVSGIEATLGSMQAQIIIRVTTNDGQVKEYQTVFNARPENLTTQVDFGETWSAQALHIEVRNMNTGEPANVHVYEIKIK